MMASEIPTFHGKETEGSDSLDDVPGEELICRLNGNYHKQFKEIGPLGKGGFGTVVKAKHQLDKSHYAVKKIHFKPDQLKEEKCLREVRALAKLESKYVVRYHYAWLEHSGTETGSSLHSSQEEALDNVATNEGYGDVADIESFGAHLKFEKSDAQTKVRKHQNRGVTLFIQMELCGENLRQWLDKRNRISNTIDENMCKEVLRIFQQILKGLEHVHSKAIKHRDIKPDNIFRARNRGGLSFKIGDFGVAKFDSQHQGLARDQALHEESDSPNAGDMNYMAPEQAGSRDHSTKSDIYSTGVMLYESLHVTKSFQERESIRQELYAKCDCSSVFTQKWPDIARLIKSMVCTEPSHRPTAEEILQLPLFPPDKKKLEHENATLKRQIDVIDTEYQVKAMKVETAPTNTSPGNLESTSASSIDTKCIKVRSRLRTA